MNLLNLQENKIPPTRNISKLDEKIPNNIKIVQVLVFFIDNLFIMTKFIFCGELTIYILKETNN